MKTFDFTFGVYRAKQCEWKGNSKTQCGAKPIEGKAYCLEHFKKAYVNISEEMLDKQTEAQLKKLEKEMPVVIEEE
ncbi:hypothetical protein RVBP17_1730 [Pseudomonas phage sp. 30-3]|uniref:Uncharacterized protein n=1 Tax=Pseudomonas phage vB_PaeM_PA5oct TaxID=2163605 RepID=A0A4Y1LUS2_9CAUD|nr:hypothetical protein PQE65_gp220 [Pseudomonas phage vB_PaeM_PA5oct]WMI31808.1 hypothetical protein GBBBJNDB_00105 [Pseudomonas phage Callisto]WPK38738.1 hypothetical protein Cassandra_0062 [Pseudomonas phage Cassandra]WPK39259.1 hypothetical protein Deiofobo_0062 [Pseudomonas phage Deifobo]WPK39771.1 hypothetical protein ETTORE_0062 [Pseudomonas phage Ettore]WPK40292.1 hypothetical protein Paride_0062 [Pseudomonas phage Paride]VOH54134.1 hypothetical protein MIJ3_00105 [Pseudomonas phage v